MRIPPSNPGHNEPRRNRRMPPGFRLRRTGLAGLSILAGLFFSFTTNAQAQAPAPTAAAKPAAKPRAHIEQINRRFVPARQAESEGAGVRMFRDDAPGDRGSEQFDIRWYANPPGLPGGALLLLETVSTQAPVVRNYTLQLTQHTEGHIHSILDIPAADVRKNGRIDKWRLRIIWRGHLLAGQTSSNWGD